MKNEPAYSQFIVANDTIYTSGQLAIDKDGAVVGPNDIKTQTEKALENMKSVLTENGFELKNIATVTIFLQDIKNDFENMDFTYREFFQNMKPARTTVEARLYKSEWLIEMMVVASKSVDNRVKD